MTTTIYPVMDGGPTDEGYGPTFPASAGMGTMAQLRESASGVPKIVPKKDPKKFIKAAEGDRSTGPKARLKSSKKPENLKVKGKKKKLGPFGEAYSQPPGNTGKGVRVAESRRKQFESMRESFRRRFKKWREAIAQEAEDEVTPPGREEQVRKLKKNSKIDNPWAVAWASYNKDKG